MSNGEPVHQSDGGCQGLMAAAEADQPTAAVSSAIRQPRSRSGDVVHIATSRAYETVR